MLKGEFTVTGEYTNLSPGCSVLPTIDVSAVNVNIKFSGMICITPGGVVSGTIRDSIGRASITGKRANKKITFQKKYSTGEMASQPPVIYNLYLETETNGNPLTLKGGYRFSKNQISDNGQVTMLLYKCAK
jgi:hypothetical protein